LQAVPFTSPASVQHVEDFGIAYHEGDDTVASDDKLGILSFRYTEPMTWWMALPAPRTLAHGAEEARRLAAAGDALAQAWVSSAFEDEKGRVPGRVLDTPWCNGVVWSMNSAPGVAGGITDFSNKWSVAYREGQYGASRKANCDGEYIDSAEAYVTEELDFRRSHFAGADRPLGYAVGSRKVGLYKGMIGYEYVRALAREMHAGGHFMMANATPAITSSSKSTGSSRADTPPSNRCGMCSRAKKALPNNAAAVSAVRGARRARSRR